MPHPAKQAVSTSLHRNSRSSWAEGQSHPARVLAESIQQSWLCQQIALSNTVDVIRGFESHFTGEYSVGVKNSNSTFSTILPSFSLASRAAIQAGSWRKASNDASRAALSLCASR